MIVNLNYTIEPKAFIAGSGKAKAEAFVSIEVYLANGKMIMDLEATGESKMGLAVVAQEIVTNMKKIPDALQEASDDLYVQMNKVFLKKIKRLKKKLARLGK